MILLDTTVLVYAVGSDHPLRDPCRRLLEALSSQGIATTTTEVIQEFVHVHSRRRTRSISAELGRQYGVALTLLSVQPDDLALGLELYEQHTTLGAFDAVLAAVAVRRDADFLVSADSAFGSIPQLRWADPGSAELVTHLRLDQEL